MKPNGAEIEAHLGTAIQAAQKAMQKLTEITGTHLEVS